MLSHGGTCPELLHVPVVGVDVPVDGGHTEARGDGYRCCREVSSGMPKICDLSCWRGKVYLVIGALKIGLDGTCRLFAEFEGVAPRVVAEGVALVDDSSNKGVM